MPNNKIITIDGLTTFLDQIDARYGSTIDLSINTSTYVITAALKDKNGTVVSSDTVDLPLESIITSATFYDTYTYDGTTYTNVIVLVLATTPVPTIVPVGALISGLVNTSDLNTALASYVPYTGASGSVNLGTHSIRAQEFQLNKLSDGISLYIGISSTTDSTHNNSASLYLETNNSIYIGDHDTVEAILDYSGISGSKRFSFPNKTGTFALTSDLNSYVPLSGTSALIGSITPSANNSITLGSQSKVFSHIYAWYAIGHVVKALDFEDDYSASFKADSEDGILFDYYDGDETHRYYQLVGGSTSSSARSTIALISDIPTVPATNVIPAISTGNKLLLSTTTSGTAKWSDFSTAGFLKTDSSGVISIDTNTYATTGSLSSYVPYSGATGGVDLGSYGVSASRSRFTEISIKNSNDASYDSMTFVNNNIIVYNDSEANETLLSLPRTGTDETVAYRSWVGNNYVPYTGATSSVYLGTNSLVFSAVNTSNNISFNSSVYSKYSSGVSRVVLAFNASEERYVFEGDDGDVVLSTASVTNDVAINFPNASGTLALTSDLSSYMPLGGTTGTAGLSGSIVPNAANINLGSPSYGFEYLYAARVCAPSSRNLTIETKGSYLYLEGGQVRIGQVMSGGSYIYAAIDAGNLSATRVFSLPNKNADDTFAMISDVPSVVYATASDVNGLFTS